MSSDYSTNQSYVSGNLVIPSSVNYNGTSYPVTSIGNEAFMGCGNITSVTIPNSVTSIGNYAFYSNLSLSSVLLSDSLISIGEYAFYYCPLLTAIVIPNTVTTIGSAALASCDLVSINIPASVTTLGASNPFFGNHMLLSITVSPDNPVYDSRNNCNAIINSNTNVLVSGCNNTVIPDSVTSIGKYAFGGVLSSFISIPNSVTVFDDYAFESNFSFSSITIPNSVTTIGEWVFGYCYNLTSVTIPNSVTSIGDYAFGSCIALHFIVVPYSAVTISNRAFIGIDTIVYCGDDSNCPWGANYYYCDSCIVSQMPDIHDTISDTILLGGTYYFPDLQISGAGDYHLTHVFSSQFGCDSVVTLHLTVLDSVVYMPDSVFHPQVTVSIGTIYNWQGNVYGNMHVESVDLSMGRVIGGDGYYKDGDVMQIYAFPKNGYKFEIWSDGVVQNPRSIAVSPSTRNTVYTAEFSAATNQQPAENNDGVEKTSTKRIYPVDCGNNFLTIRNISQYNGYGQRIVTTHVFDTMLLCEDTVDLDNGALFKIFTVMSANSSRGQVIGGDGRYMEWQQTRIAAVPYQGYKFDHWGDNDIDNPRYVTMNEETQNKIYMAYFMGENAIDVVNDGIRVYTSKGDVIIEGAEGCRTAVFDMLGRQFFNSEITSSQFIIHNSKFPVSGVYLVKIESITAVKVAIIK